jgi:DNA topoisomerase-2
MSKYFIVETQDEKAGLHFTQTWRDNMSIVDPPIVTKRSGKGFTKVTFLPDYAAFNMSGLTEPVIGILQKYVYDIAMMTKVLVHFNGNPVPIKSLVDYAKCFVTDLKSSNDILHIYTENSSKESSEIVILPSRPTVTIAFTNGIPNPEGGVHVDAWSRDIFSSLTSKINPSTKDGPKLTMAEVKSYFSIFVSCSLDNPSFASQEKSKLTAPKPETTFNISHLNKMMKWDVITKIKDLLDSKLLHAQKKLLEGPRKAHPNVKKLEDANLAGTSEGHSCILIYCEGDSAKTFAVAGIERGIGEGDTIKRGRDFFGILSSGGKILNVRNADYNKIGNNEGIQMLIQSLGLEVSTPKVDYTIDSNFYRLRYGGLMIITDADDDGIHIEGLCHNFFHSLFPSLMKRKTPFITSMKTPLVRVDLKNGDIKNFYTQRAFKEFQDINSSLIKGKPKHIKGLGTNDDAATIQCFGQRIIHFVDDENVDEKMEKAFRKNQANARKDWITSFDPEGTICMDDENAKNIESTVTDFIDNELVIFSMANCERSLPNMVDGNKQSQRKIMHTLISQNLTCDKSEKKVYRIAGDVAGLTEYSHGEQCLCDTITGMAWDFVGSNNIPLLDPCGQFGSRLAMGKDAASARYIYTKQQGIVPYIFRPEDLPILTYIQGEDSTIEPEYYVPIVPLILINGVRGGIGTGFSSKIPAYNPLDILTCLRIWIKNNLESLENIGEVIISDLPEIVPWYQGFTGKIEKVNGKYISSGIVKKLDEKTSEITELPIGMSTDKFRVKLTELRAKGTIVDFKDYSSKTRVHFIVTENSEGFSCTVKNLGLTASLCTTNMVAFDEKGKIHRYNTVDEIIYDFAQTRLKYYNIRKDNSLKTLGNQLIASTSKRRFVEEVISNVIEVYRKKRTDIISILEERKYPLHDGKYDYLLKMPIDSFTEDMIHKLDGTIEKINSEIQYIENTSSRQMWSKELDEFEIAYSNYRNKWAENENLLNCGRDANITARKGKKTLKKRIPPKKK